jgi:AcrR family transcriptional regulator
MGSVARAPRLYRGISPSERGAQRRERLLQAGLELFGTDGYAATSIRGVSAQAGLNSRYFYESFKSREDLLYWVYRRIIYEIADTAAEATAKAGTMEEIARAGLRSGWTILTEDPRKARVVALEVVGVSDRIERLRRIARHRFADLLFADLLARNPPPAGDGMRRRLDPVLTGRSLMGGVMDLLIDWINGEFDASLEEIVEHFTQLFMAVADAAAED